MPFALEPRGGARGAAPCSAASRSGARGLPRAPARLGELGWPAWIALLVACVALVPMFRAGFATVQGTARTRTWPSAPAHFLKHHAPTDVAPEEPVDHVPLVWRSKPPIYYPMAAVSAVTGHGDVGGVRAARPRCCSRWRRSASSCSRATRCGAGLLGAAVGMAARRPGPHGAADRRSTPYFNQLWGFFTLPFALAARAVRADA